MVIIQVQCLHGSPMSITMLDRCFHKTTRLRRTVFETRLGTRKRHSLEISKFLPKDVQSQAPDKTKKYTIAHEG